jgi:hypothetical protein
MTYYEVNPKTNNAVLQNLSNMDGVLQEVATTYRILNKLLAEHERSVNIPELHDFCTELQLLVEKAVDNAELITKNTRHFSKILGELNKEISKL